MQSKEPIEAKHKAPSPTADIEQGRPEKEEGPARPPLQRTTQNQAQRLPPTRAADMLAAAEPGMGASSQAHMVKGMQQSVGNARVGRMAQTNRNAPVVQRQPHEKQTTDTQPQATDAEQDKSNTATVKASADLKQKLAATILAESAAGQTKDIGWIYFNRISAAKGEAGLKGSSAYRDKGLWYQIWLYMLGDKSYAKKSVPKRNEFTGFATVKDFCEKNEYMQSVGARRAKSVLSQVKIMFAESYSNPYPDWIGQGNIDDFNNISDPKSLYWKQARAYYWLQHSGKVKETYVKVLAAGKSTQFIFDALSIQKYYQKHTLPANVELYKAPK